MHRLSGLLLAVALLFGQVALLEHEYDFAAHEVDHACDYCLHATPLTHGLSDAIALALPLPDAGAEFHVLIPRIAAITSPAYRARAPPHPAPV